MAEKHIANSATKANMRRKVSCFDSASQMVANFKVSLYFTNWIDFPQVFSRNFEEMGVFCIYSYIDIYDQILENM